MTSSTPREAYVWIWLPGESAPVVAGRLALQGRELVFNYGKSYLERVHDTHPAPSIYEPELPLRAGALPLLKGMCMPSCIRDAAPDAWGRRVILNKLLGRKGERVDMAELDELTYLLESGSDRIGALDFQASPSVYEPRNAQPASLDDLWASAERVEAGIPLTPELDQALFHGSSIGGARPKALLEGQGAKYIAKFSSSADLYSVVKAEYIAMRLAALVGITAAPVQLVRAAGKDVLLIERFDRVRHETHWARKSMVSALTILELDDMMARYASYETLAESIRHRFAQPKATLTELFSRLVFNILCGNTDDHARNHAAFWNGRELELTPAYDICPQARSGTIASQAMRILGTDNRSQLTTCIAAAHHFLLSPEAARAICQHQLETITAHWEAICTEAQLSPVDAKLLWHRQFLNPYALEGFK